MSGSQCKIYYLSCLPNDRENIRRCVIIRYIYLLEIRANKSAYVHDVSSLTSLIKIHHTAHTLFWIPKKQAISIDTSFEIKMTGKICAIETIFNSLSELHASWPGRFSQKGWVGLVSCAVNVLALIESKMFKNYLFDAKCFDFELGFFF